MTSRAASPCPPILLVVFRRPETTRQVMEAIRKARPSRLYVAADGARAGNKEEEKACEEARKIATAVDWPCQVKTLFREKNLGCRLGVSSAIDWFFEHEAEGIILEDDVVPLPSFFRFCADLLERYREDSRIGMIGGTNFQQGMKRGETSYYFSRMTHVWGWATWRRAWSRYDRDMSQWSAFRRTGGFKSRGWEGTFEDWYTPNFEAVASGKIDTWDHQWLFSCLAQNMLSVIPQENLVTNVGFGAGATHTRKAQSPLSRMATRELAFPLRHPVLVVVDSEADLFTLKQQRHSLPKRLLATAARRVARLVP